MNAPGLFVGVDGGATRTRILVLDHDGQRRARRTGPGALVRAADPVAGAPPLMELVRDALADADAQPPATALCCALAGAGRRTERLALEDELARRGAASAVRVVGDVDAALRDAFDHGPGILVIAGTGSIAVGRNAAGDEIRVGGWGERMGDEGSGFALGIAALRAVARAHDQRAPRTTLTDVVLRYADASGPAALIAWAEAADKSRIAALAPLVLQAAPHDDVAADILHHAAHHLANHVQTLHTRLGPWDATPNLALAGGVLDPEANLRGVLLDEIHNLDIHVQPLDRDIDAANGAARIAMDLVD